MKSLKNNLSNIRKPLLVIAASTALITGGLNSDLIRDVALHEGYRSSAYIPVPGDVPTIGYGSTKHPDGTPVKLGEYLTRGTAESYLVHDVNKFTKAIAKCIKVPVTEGEFKAFVSFSYNVGSSAFCKSTLVKKLNAYDYDAACAELNKWVYFKGRILPGLVNRRNKEYSTCMEGK